MNIKITYNWLKEYLDTNADPYDIQKYLSLCGPSVESVEQMVDDHVLDIEITSNRVDTASVFGIAQECAAILPRFGKRARLKFNPLTKYTLSTLPKPVKGGRQLGIKVKKKDICYRATAIVLSNIDVAQAPDEMRNRLTLCGIRSISNIVDITNYVMLSLGHPTHVFDLDRLNTDVLIFRNAKQGEKMVSFDGKAYSLTPDDVVIDDGTGRIVDLPGIVGTQNSVTTQQTKNALFFIESNNPANIRQTSMRLALRTQASTINEKRPDAARVESALVYGVGLFQELAGAKVSSEVTDVYPQHKKEKKLTVSLSKIQSAMGVRVSSKDVRDILGHLGMSAKGKDDALTVNIPTYRADDIAGPEDIIEEVARIYGYFNLPSNIQVTGHVTQPQDIDDIFAIEHKIRSYLKHTGLNEIYNYSMISEHQIEMFDLKKEKHLKLSNTISKDIEYLRNTLMPSLIKDIKDNEGKRDELRFFELAKVYLPKKGQLPTEERRLGIVTNGDYLDLKGALESLFDELNIMGVEFVKSTSQALLASQMQAELTTVEGTRLGYTGQLAEKYRLAHEIGRPVYIAEIELSPLIATSRPIAGYTPINPYAAIKLDLTLRMKKGLTYQKIVDKVHRESKLVQEIKLINTFENKLTLRLYFSRTDRNLNEDEAKQELGHISELLSR